VGLLTANIGFQSKLDLIMVYVRPLQTQRPAEWKNFTGALNDIRDAYGFRNTYVHAKWIPPRHKKAPVQRSVVRTKGGNLTLGDFPTSTAELVKAAQAIDAAGDKFMALMQTYGWLKPKRRTSRKKTTLTTASASSR
jgi:hypothetical protein